MPELDPIRRMRWRDGSLRATAGGAKYFEAAEHRTSHVQEFRRLPREWRGDGMSSRWTQASRAAALIAALCAAVAASVTTVGQSAPAQGDTAEAVAPPRGSAQPQERAPLPIADIRQILDEDAAKDRFDGAIHGWRLAPDSVLEAEGLSARTLSRSCEPKPAGTETPTQLDFTLSYIPPEITVREVSGPTKWICGGDGLSVMYVYALDTPLGSGDLFVFRAVWGQRTLDLQAPKDGVEASTINGKPAIFAKPADEAYGLGLGQVIVIEDDTEPEFTILRVFADNGVPFSELVKIAEGIK